MQFFLNYRLDYMSQKLKSLKYGCHTLANRNLYGDGLYNCHKKKTYKSKKVKFSTLNTYYIFFQILHLDLS